jgi:ribonucleases P/MRP protein subunit RPP40
VIYLDFSRAFDTVVHSKLLTKLSAFGIKGHILNWCSAFLSNRSHLVIANDCFSPFLPVLSGVPQGTVLGPLFFLIYINDLPLSVLSSKVHLFADDLKLCKEISSPLDIQLLQADLDRVHKWSQTWQLKLNTSKSSCIQIGPNPIPTAYTLNNTPLDTVQTQRDLGITVASSNKSSAHCRAIANKALSALQIITRCFHNRSLSFQIQLYKIYVRPIIEFASPTWSPHLQSDIRTIEKVQRIFTRYIPSLKGLPYAQRLFACSLPTLELRRRYFDLVHLYKIIHHLSPLNFADLFQWRDQPSYPTRLRGHPYQIFVPYRRTNTRHNSFAVRVIEPWNSLPADIVTAPSLPNFKSKLRAHLRC